MFSSVPTCCANLERRTSLAIPASFTVGTYGRCDQATSAEQPCADAIAAVTSSTRRRIVPKCDGVRARMVPSSSTELGMTLEAPTPAAQIALQGLGFSRLMSVCSFSHFLGPRV